jgi:hypothetical protein
MSRTSALSSPSRVAVRLGRLAVLAVLALCGACAGAVHRSDGAPTVFDPAVDLSLDENPNRVWQYGYTVAQVLEPSAFRRDEYESHDGAFPVSFWQPSAANHYPYIAGHHSPRTVEYAPPWPANAAGAGTPRPGWVVRAGQLAMEASNSGQYSVVRFTAPVAGRYRVSTRFEGIHCGLSTTDVHVMRAAQAMFSANIDGYGGDPAFHRVEGSNPAAADAETVELQAVETIDFAVGYGTNRTHYSDTTGLSARIELSR